MASKSSIPRQHPSTSSAQNVGDDLFDQLLKVGQELLTMNPDLFKTGVARLQSMVPREPSPVRRAAGAEQKGVQGDHGRKSGTAFHKYNLPGEMGKKEYYQCMECGERRATNSFHADHQHAPNKLVVRWFCPMCSTLYAVTHRGYHIKNRHNSPARNSAARNRHNAEKRASPDSSEEEFKSEPSSPEAKRRRTDDADGDTSADSNGSPTRVLSKLSQTRGTVPVGVPATAVPPPVMPPPTIVAPLTPLPSGTQLPGIPGSSPMGTPVTQLTSVNGIPATFSILPVANQPITRSVTQDALGGPGQPLQRSITQDALGQPIGSFGPSESFIRLGDPGAALTSDASSAFFFPDKQARVTFQPTQQPHN